MEIKKFLRKLWRKTLEYAALICPIVLLWLVMCWLKEVVPFGNGLIDYGDMKEQSEPMYLFLWDVLHGRKNLFFDWSTSLSGNMVGAVWHFGMLSPFNIFFYFIPRSWVVVSMPYYILVKLIGIGLSMDYVLNKWFAKLSFFSRMLFVLLYVFSFYNMEYYRAPMWLDLAFMFPIVMYGFFRLISEGKSLCYLISLSMTAVMSFQHTYMLALCILLITGILLVLYKMVRERLLLLCIRTIEAILLTGVIWLPGVIHIFSSKRAGRNWGIYDIWNAVWINYPGRWIKLLGLGIPLTFFFFYIIKEKGYKWYQDKEVIFFLFVIGIFTTPFIFESIHIFWHGGSYQGYPIRFGYMVAFWIIVSGAYAIANRQSVMNHRWGIALFISVVASIDMIVLAVIRYREGRSITFLLILICLCMEVVAGTCIYIVSDRIRNWLLLTYVLLHAVTAISYSWIESADIMDNVLIRGVDIADQQEELFEEHTPLDRIRSKSIITNNYALAMQQSSMSSYLAVAEKEEQDFLGDLGYAVVGDRLSDYGGTVFSDMLLGIDYIFGEKDENEELYSFVTEADGWKFYRCLYRYQTGILVDHIDDIIWKEARPFDNQNVIAKEYFDQNLLHVSETNGNSITVRTEPDSILYLYTSQMDQVHKIEIINEDTGEVQVKELPVSGWDNGIQELGSWQGENLIITVSSEETIQNLQVAVLKLDDVKQLQPRYGIISDMKFTHNAMKMELVADAESYLYLPVYGSKGWHCTVNGKRVMPETMIRMLAIPVQKGNNSIELHYVSPGMKTGMLLSLLGLVIILGEKLLLGKCTFLMIPQRQFKVLNISVILLWSVIISIVYIGSTVGLLAFIFRSVI